MSGKGSPTAQSIRAEGLRVGVVAASWHERVMNGLLDGAQRALADADVVDAVVVRVAGSFELSVVAAHLARSGYDAVVALGAVIRGGTPHFDYVCQSATAGLTQVSVDTGVPVGFGVLTCDTDEQALDRAGLPGSSEDRGYEVTHAALATAVTLRDLRAAGQVAPTFGAAPAVSAAGFSQSV